jgi:hypothetical protein
MPEDVLIEEIGSKATAGRSSREWAMRLAWSVLLVLVLSLFVVRLVADGPYGKDYTNFLTSGRIMLAGQAANLYNLETQTEAQKPVAGPYVYEGGVLPFIYPPYVAIMFSPFALLPADVGYYVWTAIQAILLIVFVVWAVKSFSDWHLDPPPALPFALLAFQPVTEALLQGQTSIINLVLWWWALVAWRSERWALLGVAAGLAAFKPQIAVMLAVALLFDGRWRSLGYAALTQALLWLGPVMHGGMSIVTGYIDMVRTSSTTAGTLGFVPGFMPSLRGLLTIFGVSPEATMWPTLLGWVVGLALTAVIWRTSRPLAARFGATAVIAVLLSPHLYPHDVSLLLVSVVCALLVGYSSTDAARRLNLLFVPFVLVFLPMYLLVFQMVPSYTPMVLSVWLLGIVLFYMLWSGKRRTAVARQAA